MDNYLENNKERIKDLINKKKRIVRLLEEKYILARGYKNMKSISEKDFIRWIFERKEIGNEYVDFLENLNLSIKTPQTAEIGKSMFDTIVSSFDTTVITPHDYFETGKRVLKYDFFPNREPRLIKYNDEKMDIIPVPEDIKQFITQNPYDEFDLIGYEDLFNGNYDVIVGMYGHIHDNDKERKLRMLRDLKDKITTNRYNIEYECSRDAYFAAIYNKNEKTKSIN